MKDKVGKGVRAKRRPREERPASYRSAIYLRRLVATQEERAALDAAEADFDRAAEALAALVPAKAFLAKLKDLARGRVKLGRPPRATEQRAFMRFLLEATGDVEGKRINTGEANRAAAECLIAAEGRSETHFSAYMKAAQEERERLIADYAAIETERERAFRTAFAFSFLETADWTPHEKKAVDIFLARFGAFDLAIEKSPGASRRRTED